LFYNGNNVPKKKRFSFPCSLEIQIKDKTFDIREEQKIYSAIIQLFYLRQ
jgi:hypothetical protein